ncbi:MAG TPA: RodZ domain-containing protein [Chloroflexota bacterium]
MEPERTPLSVGELLRRERDARGLTLHRVEADTKIRRAYLEALERDDLGALPAPVFTRGLVRSYARYLGLSPVDALELLNKGEARLDEIGVLPAAVRPRLSPAPLVRLVWGAVVALSLGTIAGLLYLGLPAYESFFGATTVRAQATAAPTREPLPTATPRPTAVPTAQPSPTVPPSPTPPPSPTIGAAGQATATAAAAVRGVTIEARVGGRVWAQVESDGQIVYSGILMPGEKRTWKAEKRVLMHVGDGGLIEVAFNGRALGPVGPDGEVVKSEWVATR